MEKLTLTVVLGAALGGAFKGVFGSARNELTTLGRSIKETEQQLKQIGRIPGLEDNAEKLAYKLTLARQALQKLEGQYESAKATGSESVSKVYKQMEKARSAVQGLEGELQRENEELTRVKASLTQAGIGTHNLASESQRLGQVLEEQNAALARAQSLQERRSQAWATMKGEWAKIGAAAGLVKTATGTAIQFESAMADVRKVVNFDSPVQFKEMGQDIQKLASRLPMAADGIAAIVAAGGQAGFARQELLKFAEDATKMGIAFDTTADQAGQMMAQWRTSFKLGQKDVVALADKINYLSNTGPATAQAISDIVTRIGPLGEVAGIASGQIAALGSTVAGMGIAPEIAATGIKNMMLALNAGESATKAQRKAFDALGLSATDVAKRMQTDATGAITMVLQKLKQLPKEEQAAALQQLFGKESIAAIAPMLTNLDLLKENLRKVGDATQYAGSMEKEYQSRAATTANNAQLLKNNFARLGNIIGTVFLPPLNLVMGSLGWLVGKVADLADRFPLLTAAVVAGGTAWLTYRTAVAATQFALTYMPGVVTRLTTLFPLLSGVMNFSSAAMATFGAVLMATPIGWIIAGVAALAGVGLLIYKYWQPLSAFFGGFFSGLLQGLAPIGAAFSQAFGPIGELIGWVAGKLGELWDWFVKLLAPVQSSSAELQGATESGRHFGLIVGEALSTIFGWASKILFPLQAVGAVWDFIKKKMGKDAPQQATAPARNVAAAAVIAGAAAAAPMAAAAKPAPAPVQNNTSITVHAAPGMDEKKLALEVRKQMDAHEREKASKKNGALYDND